MVKSSASMHRRSVDLTTNHRHSHNFALVRKSVSYQKELRKISSSEDIVQQRPQPLVSPEIAASFTDSLQFRYDPNTSGTTTTTSVSTIPIIAEHTKESGVRFADQVEETTIPFQTSRDILSRKDMTQDEVRAYWYSRNHLEWIKKDLQKLGRRYGFQFTYHSYDQDLRRNDSLRGAELLHSQYGRLYQHRVNVATKTVLQTQQDSCQGTGTNKYEAYELCCQKIATTYAQLTKVTQREAYARAHTDMKVAENMYRLMDQDAKEIKPIHLTTTHKAKDDPTTTASISSPPAPLPQPPVLDEQQEQARSVPSPTEKPQQRGARPSPHTASAITPSATTSCCVVM